jgi:hypothetical protein
VSPVVWSVICSAWYVATKDFERPAGLLFVPWWVLMSGILSYMLAAIGARWGRLQVIGLLMTGTIVGLGAWRFAGIEAALWCGLVVPLMIGNGCLRLPPWATTGSATAMFGLVLGILEPLLIIALIIATIMVVIHHVWLPLPGWPWWWVALVGSIGLLACSLALQRQWRRHARRTNSTGSSAAMSGQVNAGDP